MYEVVSTAQWSQKDEILLGISPCLNHRFVPELGMKNWNEIKMGRVAFEWGQTAWRQNSPHFEIRCLGVECLAPSREELTSSKNHESDHKQSNQQRSQLRHGAGGKIRHLLRSQNHWCERLNPDRGMWI